MIQENKEKKNIKAAKSSTADDVKPNQRTSLSVCIGEPGSQEDVNLWIFLRIVQFGK